jgi:hypothetical protein
MKTVDSNATLSSPVGLMWDGKHITLAGESYTGRLIL